MRAIRRPPKWQEKAYEGLCMYQSIETTLQRGKQLFLKEVHDAIEWQQSKKTRYTAPGDKQIN